MNNNNTQNLNVVTTSLYYRTKSVQQVYYDNSQIDIYLPIVLGNNDI